MAHLINENINGYYTLYDLAMVLTKNSSYPSTTVDIFIDVFMGDRTGHLMGRYGPEDIAYTTDEDFVIVTTIQGEDETRYSYQGPDIEGRIPIQEYNKTSDYVYDSGQFGEIKKYIEQRNIMKNELIMNPFCYKIPWNVVIPEYPTLLVDRIEEFGEITSSLIEHTILGDVSYEESLQVYRDWAKKIGMQEFLDQQNQRLGVKSGQSY